MDRALGHAEVLLIEGNGHELVDTIADVPQDVLLEGNALKLHLIFDFFGSLQLELLWSPVVQKIAKHQFNFHNKLSLVETQGIGSLKSS